MKFRNRQTLAGKDEAAWLDAWATRNAPKKAPADLDEAAAKLAEKAESDAEGENISLKMALKFKGYAQTVHYMCDLLDDAAE
jgi:hypothetical protein